MSKKCFLFLLYCLRFDDSTTRDQQRDIDKPAPIRSVYERFVTGKNSYTPGIIEQLMRVCLDFEENVVSSNIPHTS